MPVPQPEEVIGLANELKDARDHLAVLEARWVSFFSQGANGQFAPVLNLKPRIIQFLEDRADFSFNMTTVAKALGANENSVGPYLSELAKEGKIEKRDRGLYGATRETERGNGEITDDDIPF